MRQHARLPTDRLLRPWWASRLVGLALVLTGTVLAGGGACPGTVPTDSGPGDGDGDLEDGGTQDAGLVVTDAGAEDAGPPLTDDQLAKRLCETTFRGQVNLAAHASPPARCSMADAIDDTQVDPGLIPDTTLECLPGRPVYEMFFRGITGGRVIFDADKIESCMAAARAVRAASATWGDFENREAGLMALLSSPDCAGAAVPQVVEGEQCQQLWDCPAGTACEAEPLDGTTLSCIVPASQGDPCGVAKTGVSLRSCDESSVCFNGLCVFPRSEGQLCGPTEVPCEGGLICGPAGTCALPGQVGDICGNDAHCEAPAFCRLGMCALPIEDNAVCVGGADRCASPCAVCRPSAPQADTQCLDRGAAGTPCTTNNHCRSGFFCDEGSCAAAGVVGADCGPGAPCLEGLTCSNTIAPLPPPLVDGGVLDAGGPDPEPEPVPDDGGIDAGPPPGPYCQVPPTVGNACAEGAIPCAFGFCVNGVCRTGAAGERCHADSQCAEGNLCVADKCVLAPREGAPCTTDLRCASDLYCDGERCLSFPVAGELCGPNNQCAQNAFCNEGSCEAKLPPGQSCLSDEQCVSGTCLITLTCAAGAADGNTDRDLFLITVLFGGLVPVGAWRLRRRRR